MRIHGHKYSCQKKRSRKIELCVIEKIDIRYEYYREKDKLLCRKETTSLIDTHKCNVYYVLFDLTMP